MERIDNEQTLTAATATEVEKSNFSDKQDEVSLGKFKDVNSLLNAYNSLQAEFTKRCQRIKELERAGSNDSEKLLVPNRSEENGNQSITDEVKKQIIADYLKTVATSGDKPIVLADCGASVITPVRKPKTIDEAGVLAQKLFKNKE